MTSYDPRTGNGMIPPNMIRPLQATLILSSGVVSYPCVVDKIDLYAGDAVGSAIVRYPASNANDVTRTMGDIARISIGGTVFRGCVGHGPFEVSTERDEIQLVLFDDKWRMGFIKIGTPGIGPATNGFTDVDYELIFNRDGKPNKAAASLDFSMASTAVFWTLRDVIKLVFQYYVPGTVATLPDLQIAHAAWARKPSNLNLYGMSPVQAVTALAQLAGETWALIPDTSTSTFRSVRPGSGTQRALRLFMPGTRATAAGATEGSVAEINQALSIQNCRDEFHVASSDIVKESVYSVANGLLINHGKSPLQGYARRFKVDVTQYAANSLGANRAAGSRPKPWQHRICTRIITSESGQTYATAADILSNPTYEANEHVEIPVWISEDGTVGNMKLLTGGYRINTEYCLLDLEATPEVLDPSDREKKRELLISNWANVGIWMTVTTVLEGRELKSSEAGAHYLPSPVTEVVQRADLVPERRQKSLLPKLTGDDGNLYDTIAATDEEKYVDVTARLADALAAMESSSQAVESPITAVLPFFPVWQLGDRVVIVGRPNGATGNEVITKITYNVGESYDTAIEATNVMIAVDPAKFVGKHR